jgi:Uma2 family endonuclease
MGATVPSSIPTTEMAVKESVLLTLPIPRFTDDEFFDFCLAHPELRLERTASGRIVVMAGTGGRTGSRNAFLTAQLINWAVASRLGIAFDSSTMFRLPDSSMRSPDAAWVSRERVSGLTDREKERFLPLCPDFVIELTSPSDELDEAQAKMEGWMANGCSLAWLLDPATRTASVYRPGQPAETFPNPTELSGEGVAAGFCLNLTPIWDPGW